MKLSIEQSAALLDYFTAYASEYNTAQQLATVLTLGEAVAAGGSGLPTWLNAPILPDTSARTFVITYIPPGSPATGAPTPTNQTSDLVFDVDLNTPGLNGVPQRVSYTSVSRQSYEQTVIGFHVNEFGLGIGRLDIDALVIFRGQAPAQVQAFFDFLRIQKANGGPLNTVSPSGEVLFSDVYLDRQLKISIENIAAEEVAGTNYQAHLTMSAGILLDYTNPATAPKTSSPSAAQQKANASSGNTTVDSVLNFVGITFP